MGELSVSIVTPSYNQAEFIGDTLESVERQTYDDLTHFVVDGESDDGTIDVLDEYDAVRWTSEPDRGQTHAINKGFERANGDVVGWLNSDDPYVYRDTVSKVVEAFRRTGADVVYGHAITIGPDNELLRVHHLPKFDKKRLERHCFLVQPSVFFRDHVIDENRLNEDRAYSMDYEFWLDLADDYEWYRLDEIVAADRNHPHRKIIRDAESSRADTAALRTERGINQGLQFSIRQLVDKAALRGRRLRTVPRLLDLLRRSDDSFAFPLQRPSMETALWTQLFRGKKEL